MPPQTVAVYIWVPVTQKSLLYQLPHFKHRQKKVKITKKVGVIGVSYWMGSVYFCQNSFVNGDVTTL